MGVLSIAELAGDIPWEFNGKGCRVIETISGVPRRPYEVILAEVNSQNNSRILEIKGRTLRDRSIEWSGELTKTSPQCLPYKSFTIAFAPGNSVTFTLG